MEPLTHRLTHEGVPIPCSHQFATDYMNMHGMWVRTYPKLHVVPPPETVLYQDEQRPGKSTVDWENLDWSKGGVYTDEDLERIEMYQDYSRTVTALSATLYNQRSMRYMSGELITAGMLFPDLAVPDSPTTKFFKGLRKFFHYFGELSSILVTIFMLGRAIHALGTWMFSIEQLRFAYGVGGAIVRTIFFDCFMARMIRNSEQGQQAREQRQKEAEIRQKAKEEEKRQLIELHGGTAVEIEEKVEEPIYATISEKPDVTVPLQPTAPARNAFPPIFPNLANLDRH